MRELTDERDMMLEKLEKLEEEEKKKKKKEALNYFTAAYFDKIEELKKKAADDAVWAARMRNDLRDFFKKERLMDLLPEYRKQSELLAHYESTIETMREYFKLDDNDPLKHQVEEDLVNTKFSRTSFAALSLCAANDKFENICRKMMHGEKEKKDDILADESEFDLEKTKKQCMKEAIESLHDYRFGKHERIAKLLAKGLTRSCKLFSKAKTEQEAMEMSAYAGEMMHIMKMNPKFKKLSGLSEKQFGIADKMARLGEEIRKGVMAVELLIASGMDKSIKLSDKERQNMIETAVGMKTALADKQKIAREWDEPEKTLQQPAPGIK